MKTRLGIMMTGTVLAGSLLFAAEGVPPLQEKPFSFRVYGIAESYEWTETYLGQQIVKESGPLFGIGGEVGAHIPYSYLWMEGRGDFFFGEVDYDGGLSDEDGNYIPYSSTTEYSGFELQGDLALKFTVGGGVYLKPYVGLGVRSWRRVLDTGWDDSHIGRYGYIEEWATFYSLVGGEVIVSLGSYEELFARVEGRFPLDNQETADLSNQGGPRNVEFEPGKRPSIYAEVGLNFVPFTVSCFLETLSFSRSPMDWPTGTMFQPESEATMLGAKFGAAF